MLFALLLAPVLAGCLNKPQADGTPAPTGSDGSPPTSGGPGPTSGPGGNVTIPQIRWENCTGMIGTFEAPRDRARDLIPAAFYLTGETPATASFRFYAIQCPRTTIADQVLENEGRFEVYAEVGAANETWSDRGIQLYNLDFLTTSPELAAATALLGAPSKTATLTRETETTDAGAGLERWKFAAEGLVVEVEYPIGGQPLGGFEGVIHHWHDAVDGFRRVEIQGVERNDLINEHGGVLRLEGSSRVGSLFADSCCIAWAGQTFSTLTELWTGNETIFR